jgi:hypothetical protein
LLKLLHRWRKEAGTAEHQIKRIAVAYEAGRDGFWLARWLRMRDIDTYVIHPTSVAVSREQRRFGGAKSRQLTGYCGRPELCASKPQHFRGCAGAPRARLLPPLLFSLRFSEID